MKRDNKQLYQLRHGDGFLACDIAIRQTPITAFEYSLSCAVPGIQDILVE
jgi:hypothetical protein